MRRNVTLMERLMEKVLPVPESGCWLWTGDRNEDGYGRVTVAGIYQMAHRTAYIALKGPIPEGKHIDHLCRVRCCVNPDHMEPVTPEENVLRGIGPTAVNARKDTCVRGHSLVGHRVSKRGRRECLACQRLQQARYRARDRANGVKRVRSKPTAETQKEKKRLLPPEAKEPLTQYEIIRGQHRSKKP